MSARPMHVDPDVGIPDLVRRLGDDSKRLVSDEVRLAKLEMRESIRDASRGAIRLGIAFGVGIVALTALTVLLVSAFGRLFGGNYWAGALVTGALELVVAALMIKRGVSQVSEADYTLEETREEAKETVKWASTEMNGGNNLPVPVTSTKQTERSVM